MIFPSKSEIVEFALQFENGIFLNLLKYPQVISVFKRGSRLLCNNLSNIVKIVEKSICKRLNHFLEQHKVLYALQFGFRLRTSTIMH